MFAATKVSRQIPRVGGLKWDMLSKDDIDIHRMTSVPTRGKHAHALDDTDLSNLETSSDVTRQSHLKPFASMPGPKGMPIIGTLWDYVKKDGHKFNKMFEVMQTRATEFGPVYKEKIGHLRSVVVSDPLEYSKVIRADGTHPHRIELEPMVIYRQRKGMSLGTVNSQGEEWYRHRTILSKKMLRPKEVTEYLPAMNVVANDFMTYVNEVRSPEGVVDKLEHQMFKWALESIGTVLFEERIGCFSNPPSKLAQQFIVNLMGFFHYMQPLMYNVPIYKIYPTKTWKIYEEHTNKVLDAALYLVKKKMEAIARQAKRGVALGEKEEKSAFLTYLLAQKNLTPEEAMSHAIDMMMGGVETTSNATMWTLYNLARFPAAQEALHKEIQEVLPNNAELTESNLPDLPYVKACLKETFRLYPITFATSRIIPKDIEVGGYHVPAGSHLQANLYGMGRDPKLFTNPERYVPERWLRGNLDEMTKSLGNLTWGHGARMCLGRRVAEQEIYLVLCKFISKFRVEYHEDKIEPVLNTVMTPDRPLKLTFIPRDGTLI